jgi:hypothetical protein
MSATQPSIISERAYAIWEQQGRPEGEALNHWLQAEAELAHAVQALEPTSDQCPAEEIASTRSLKGVVRKTANKRSAKKS